MIVIKLKYIVRSLWWNKLSSMINIFGLSVAMASTIVLVLWIRKELSYNTFFPNTQQIRQVITNTNVNDEVESFRSTSYPIIEKLKEASSVREVVHLSALQEQYALQYQDGKELFPTGKLVSSNFFSCFKRPFVYGNPVEALRDPSSMVITETLARNLLGSEWKDKIAEANVSLGTKTYVQISAVVEDFPHNSTIQFDYCLPKQTEADEHIGSINYETYLLLEPNTDQSAILKSINKFIEQKVKATVTLQPFADVYLYSNFYNGKVDGGRITYVRLFSVATLFIIIMATINFMNLFTASSFKKSKEVGMKKIIGANRFSLMFQMLLEALLLTTLSAGLALTAIYFLLPRINSQLQSEITLPVQEGNFWILICVLPLILGILAGIYPSWWLTSLKPMNILKANTNLKIGGLAIQRALFAFQFFISIVLINFTFSISQQIRLLHNSDLGYDRKQLLIKRLSPKEIEKIDVIKDQLNRYPAFSNITVSGSDLISGVPMTSDVSWPHKNLTDSSRFGVLFVDHNFMETLKIPSRSGNFPKEQLPGVINVVLNETALAMMGGEKNVFNEVIHVWDADVKVTGLIKDFNFNSLFNQIQPLILVDMSDQSEYLIARIKEGNEGSAISALKSLHEQYSPNESFTFSWLDDKIATLYKNESLTGLIAKIFSLITVIIASLGFFGLTNFTFKQKAKEVSIRKVVGATYLNIILFLFKDFFKLILIATIFALPLSWFLINEWLNKFAYHINLTVESFLIPVLFLLLISALTVLYHSVRAYVLKPILFLREE